jgi:hypothetical protein
MAELPLYRDHARQRQSGWAVIQSAQDGVLRLNYFTRVPDYPLFVTPPWPTRTCWPTGEAQRAIAGDRRGGADHRPADGYLLRVVRMRDRAEEEIEKKNLSSNAHRKPARRPC